MLKETKPRIDTVNLADFVKPNEIGSAGPFVYAVVYEEDLYIKDNDGNKTSLIMTEGLKARQKHTNSVAFVIHMGSECYKDNKGNRLPVRCKVGDWIIYPRHESSLYTYKGYPLVILYDDRVYGTTNNPELFYMDY